MQQPTKRKVIVVFALNAFSVLLGFLGLAILMSCVLMLGEDAPLAVPGGQSTYSNFVLAGLSCLGVAMMLAGLVLGVLSVAKLAQWARPLLASKLEEGTK